MTKQREGKISKRIIDALTAKGYYAFKVHGSEYQPAGLPDILACVEGLYIGFETKLPETRANVSPIQQLRHEQIAAAGGKVFVVCSANEALRVLKSYLEELDELSIQP